MSLLTTLTSARNHIAKHGHYKGAYTSVPITRSNGLRSHICATAPLCLDAALIRYSEDYDAYRKVKQFLLQHQPCYINWNDEPTTTQQDVLDLLDRAIAAVV